MLIVAVRRNALHSPTAWISANSGRGVSGGGEGEGGPDLNNRDGEYSSQKVARKCFGQVVFVLSI